jgi:hypothetical protein
MQKRIFFGLAIAALASAGFAIANNSTSPSLTPAQLENLEAFSDPIFSFDDYDKVCVSWKDVCVLGPMLVIEGIPQKR